jgi:16S rRNA (cytidine1402-2'-O)-methyltransferase
MLSSLQDMQAIFGDQRNAAVCRELTKIHEEILRSTLSDLSRHFTDNKPRGEFTLVIAGKPKGEQWQAAAVRTLLQKLVAQGMKHSDASRQVASQSGWTRQQVYRLALEE